MSQISILSGKVLYEKYETKEQISENFPKLEADQAKFIPKTIQAARTLSMCFFATGLFAVIGALYTWGDGSIFNAPAGSDLNLYIAEMVVTAPCSFIAAIGYRKLRKWGLFTGLITTGIYIYGTVLIYISFLFISSPIPLKLILPPIFGIGFSLAVLGWSWKNLSIFT